MSMTETPAFTPPGIRTRRTLAISNGKPAEPNPPISAKLTPILAMVDEVQRERDRLRDALDTANARIEQFESTQTRLVSEIESERARTAAALADAEAARTRQAQLETVIHGMVNMGTDALPSA